MQADARVGTETILFSDLVGSTEMRGRMGEGRADELRREHDALLRRSIERNNGMVVKTLGDGFMATFPSASAGLAAAVDVQRTFSRRNAAPSARGQLVVRLGLSVGDVVVEGGDRHGTPVVEASRLCDSAAGGEVLVTSAIRQVAGGRAVATFIDRGLVAYKGLADSVPTLELIWRDDDRRWPLPAGLERSNDPMIGRQPELLRLETAWSEAVDGRPRLALVRGEPGIGKSTVVAELAESVSQQGGLVLSGHCDPHLDVPYQPFVEALRSYVAMVGGRLDRLGDLPGELARLVPELRELIPDLPPPMDAEPDTQRYRLAEAVASWLLATSSRSPVLLVLEDVHWAGKGTASLLRHLLSSQGTGAVMVVATARDAEPGDEVSPELTGIADVHVALRGLATDALVEWLEVIGEQELDDDGREFAATLERDTGGNPLYVREVLRHLVETGWLHREDGRWTSRSGSAGAVELPGSLREVLLQRLNHLAEESRKVLGAAAVIGRTFELHLLREVGGIAPLALADALDALREAGLLSEADGESWMFTHALVQQATLDVLGPTRRAALHLEIAEALSRRDGVPAAEVARHWAEASPLAGPDRAAEALVVAADAAIDQLAFDEAIAHLDRALGFVRDRDRHLALSLRLGMVQQRGGDERYRATLEDVAGRAVAAGDGPTLVQAAISSARPGIWFSSVGLVDHGLVRRYEQAIEAVGPQPSRERATLHALLAQELHWSNDDRDRRHAFADEALAVARAVGDDCVDAIIPMYVMAKWEPSTRADRLARVDELESHASGTGTLETRFFAHYLRQICLGEAGEMEAALAELEVTSELADELRFPILRWRCLTRRGAISLLQGPSVGEPHALAALEVGQASGQPDALSSFGAQYILVSWDRGTLVDLVDSVITFVDAMPGVRAWRAVLAMVYMETEQWDLCAEQLSLISGPDCMLPADSAWMVGTALLGECAAALGDRDRAAVLYELLAPYEGAVVDVVQGLSYLGSVDRVLGLLSTCLERWDDADRHFLAARAIDERIGAVCFAVRTRRDHALSLIARGRGGHDDALELVRSALRDARNLGMTADTDRLSKLLQRLETAGAFVADEGG